VTTLPIHFHTDNADEEEEKLPTTTWRSSRIPPRARDVSSSACVPRTRVYRPPLSFSLFFSALPPTWNSVFQPPSNVGRRWRPRLFEGTPSLSRQRLFLPFCFYPSSATYLSASSRSTLTIPLPPAPPSPPLLLLLLFPPPAPPPPPPPPLFFTAAARTRPVSRYTNV